MTEKPFVFELLIGKGDLIEEKDEEVLVSSVVGSVFKWGESAEEERGESDPGSVVGGLGVVVHGGAVGFAGDLDILNGGGVFLKKVISGKDSIFILELGFSLQFSSSDPLNVLWE